MKSWYEFRPVAKRGDTAELLIYGDIGASFLGEESVSAQQFVGDLQALAPKTALLRVRVNSLGGDPFDAVAIANALRGWADEKPGRRVETMIDGIAASAASVVIMAGSRIAIAENALIMVHNPWMMAVGNADHFRKVAGDLDTIRGSLITTYQWHSTLSVEELGALLAAETWMDADEAIAKGFATDKVSGGTAPAAAQRAAAFASLTIPERFRDRIAAFVQQPSAPARPPSSPTAAAAPDVLSLCRAGECLDLAESLIIAQASVDQVKARIADARAIKASCALARMPELAEDYIAAGMPLDRVKRQLVAITARVDHGEIDTSLDTRAAFRSPGTPPPFDVRATYAERNRRQGAR